MTYTNAVAVALIASNGVIDKLELETIVPVSHRTFLANYQAKLAANKSTTKTEDRRFLAILQVWMIQRHKITA
jgi:hypothetical protein